MKRMMPVLLVLLLAGCLGLTDLPVFTITYQSNGAETGSVPLDSAEYSRGDSLMVQAATGLGRTGYTFAGWSTSAVGGTLYQAGDEITFGTSDIELYAQWTAVVIPTYTVTYAGNGSDGGAVPTDATLYEEGDSITVPGPETLTKTGYSFGGWTSGGLNYAEGDAYTFGTSDVMFTAVWTSPLDGIPYREMASVPGGTFFQSMLDDSGFTHTLSAFSLGKFEVTYFLWYTVRQWALENGYVFANTGREGLGSKGESPENGNQPVTTINWRDTLVWCNAYSEMTGLTPVYLDSDGVSLKKSNDSSGLDFNGIRIEASAGGYRIPTEAEWLYAASYIDGSKTTPLSNFAGDDDDYETSIDLAAYAWYSGNSGETIHDVGMLNPTALDLYDMSGNVMEWSLDKYISWPEEAQTDYYAHSDGGYRIRRGGSWADEAFCRIGAYKKNFFSYFENEYTGFRLARTE